MRQKIASLLILILLTFFISCSKKEKKNNLIIFLDSDKYALFSSEDKASYLDSITKEIDDMPIDSVTKNIAFKISSEYYYLDNNDKSFKLSQKAFDIAESLKDSLGMGRALYYMGDCYEFTKKDSAYYYYKESENIFRLIGNKERLAKVHFNKSYLLFYEGNFAESEVEVIKALQNLNNSKNYKLKYSCYSLQGSIHNEFEEYDKALFYFSLAEESYYEMSKVTNKNNESLYDYYVLNVINSCNIYDKKGEYKKSISELNKVNTKKLKENWPNLHNLVIGNLAYSKMKNGDLEESKFLFEEALTISKNNKNEKGYLYKVLNYGEFNLIQKDTIKAKKYLNEALNLSKRINSGKETLKALDFLSKIDLPNSAFYKNEYIRISDSIIKQQRSSSNKFARIEYETNKLENVNELLNKRNVYLLLSSSLLIIIFLIILGIRHRKAKKREIEFLELRKDADNELFELIKDYQIQLVRTKESVQNRIAKELHDGVMNNIYSVRLNLGFLNSSDDETMKEKRLVYITELQKIEREIRELSHDLSHETNTKLVDYKYLLSNMVENINEISSTNYLCIIEPKIKWNKYSSVIKINIYRILQELCSNVDKYAKADNCIIKLTTIDKTLTISIIDDGIGFDTSKITDGIGMKNIKQRINTINGILEIISNKDEGTQIIFKIPKNKIGTKKKYKK